MFQTTGMSECKDNCLVIGEMSEAGVRAMLQFIYWCDLEEPAKNCEMALELLEAGHKYLVEDLENAMLGIFGAMTCKWFTVDVALKLFRFSRSARLGNTEKRGLQVLKW